MMSGIFSVCAPTVRHAPPPPVTAHVLLHKSLYKFMVRGPGSENNLHPQSWGHKPKRSEVQKQEKNRTSQRS